MRSVPAAKTIFDGLTEASTSAAGRALLAKTRELFGFAPNLAVAMSADPAALEGYLQVLQAFGGTSLDPIEQQIVLMAVSRANQADYSVAVHATLATKLGAAAGLVKAAGTGATIEDPRYGALRRFAEALTVGRGQVSDAEIEEFLAAGYKREAVVAVAFGVAVKTFANAIAHLAHTPVDDAFAPALSRLRA
jgi:AhpD family alkylhydroperoxidase